MKKTVLFILIAVLILVPVTGCSPDAQEKTDTPDSSNPEVTQAETTETVDPDIQAIYNNKLDGETIAFIYQADYYLGENECEISYELSDIEGDVLKEAVYQRARYVEENLNVKISVTITYAGKYPSVIKNLVASGDSSIDAAAAYKRTTNELAVKGNFYNLRTIGTLNLDKNRWDQNFNRYYSYNNGKQQYIATGDILYNDNYTNEILYFNKKLIDDYALESPYDLVRKGSWTIEEMSRLISEIRQDINGDGKYDTEDQWGLSCNSGALATMLANFGMPSVTVTADGQYVVTADIIGETYYTAAQKIWETIRSSDTLLVEDMGDDYKKRSDMAANSQFLFWSSAIGSISNFRNVSAFDFGLLPYPKYNENQEQYLTVSSPWAAVIAVLSVTAQPDQTGIVLEALAASAADMLVPVAIEKQIITKATRDDDSIEMLKISFNNMSYDLLTDNNWSNFYNMTCGISLSDSFNLVSKLESIHSGITKALDNGIGAYTELLNR